VGLKTRHFDLNNKLRRLPPETKQNRTDSMKNKAKNMSTQPTTSLRTRLLGGLLLALASLAGTLGLRAQSPTAFTYQGQLTDNGSPANGNYDLTFQLFDAATNGDAVGPILTNSATPVSNGLFTVTLDYGAAYFQSPTNFWLALAVHPTQGTNGFTELTPRQLLGSTPQAIFALSAGSAASSSNFSGAITGDVTGSQGSTVVTSVGGQTAASIASGVLAANGATSSDAPDALVARDDSGSFSAGSLTLGSNLYLPFPGIIYSGTNTAFVEEGSLFVGLAAGAHQPINPDEFNVGVGDFALFSDTTGSYNTAGGEYSMYSNTTGSYNKADGYKTLYSNTTGSDNTANGSYALYANTTASSNMANGYQSLYANTSGYNNTASGAQALLSNTSGYDNTASGVQALHANTTATGNTANGYQALYANTTGNYNTADGLWSLIANTTGGANTAAGYNSLTANTIGTGNVAVGVHSLKFATAGTNNTVVGYAAFGSTGTTGNFIAGYNDIAVGYLAGANLVSGTNDIYIGNQGAGENFSTVESEAIRIGALNNVNTNGVYTNTYIAGIWDTTLPTSNMFVVVDSGGHLGTSTGSGLGSSVTSVTGIDHITAIPTTGNVVVESDATPLDTFGTIVSRDGNGSFNANNIALGNAVNGAQNGVLNLPATTANSGMITLGGDTLPFLQGYGSQNFFGGVNAGNFTLTGSDNVGVGYLALAKLTTGVNNTANGAYALTANTTGLGNAASGAYALAANIDGYYNEAIGAYALTSNTHGVGNSANGGNSLYANTTGSYNTASGGAALYSNTTGSNNTADGFYALYYNTTGSNNTASGQHALELNTTGSLNSANGAGALSANTTGNANTANGYVAMQDNTTGSANTATGAGSLQGNLTGDNNTANGYQALEVNTSGSDNTANGYQALVNNKADDNTATGYQALYANRTGYGNTANGLEALFSNDTGYQNVANGEEALYSNSNGYWNVANGVEALYANTTGTGDTANGYQALYANTTGNYNTGDGLWSLLANTTGGANTAVGYNSLTANTTGSGNVVVGVHALKFATAGSDNTSIGYASFGSTGSSGNFTNGDNDIALGYLAGANLVTGDNDIYIGNQGMGPNFSSSESGIIRIGQTNLQTATYLVGTVYANSVALTSDRNAKENFKPVDSQAMLAKVASLPVTEWNYKSDSKESQHIGPMAQDFQAAFQLSADDKHISVVDEGGVALAAIQGLNEKLETQLKGKDSEIQDLKTRLNELEAAVKSITDKK
jgi:hypothetical protein